MNLRRQFTRFLLVGGLATACHYLILVVLVQTGLTQPLTASNTGFALSAVLNYLLNRRFTFASQRPHREAAPRFALVAATGLAINAGLFWLVHNLGGQNYLLAQVAATIGTICWNFALNRIWTFARPGAPAAVDKETSP